MKKTIIYISALLLASFSSCTKDGLSSTISEFTPYVDDYMVKSALSIDGKYSFQDGDKMLVTNGSEISEFTYDEKSDKFRTSSPIARKEKMQAVFPASAAKYSKGSFTVTLPEKTSVNPSTIQQCPLYLWKVRGDVFKFKSFCGIARVHVVGSGTALYESSLSKVTFTSTGNPCSGTAKLATDGSLEFTTEGNTLEVICEDGMDIRSDIYMVLPAHKYPMGSSLSFQFADGKGFSSETIMGIVPRSGMIKSYEIEVQADFFGPLEDYEEIGPLE